MGFPDVKPLAEFGLHETLGRLHLQTNVETLKVLLSVLWTCHMDPTFRKRPDVHKIVLSIKLRSPPPRAKSVNFEDFLVICAVFPHFGRFWGGGVKPNFADKNFMDTQTFLIRASEKDPPDFLVLGATFVSEPWILPLG